MKQGLILVDIQNDYFTGGKMELVGMDQAAENAGKVLQQFREKEQTLFHIQHISARPGAAFFLPDTTGVEINEAVAPQADETIVTKSFPNSFRETDLLNYLRKSEVENVVICGAMSHMCIDATTRAAFDLGFQCTVIGDACATRDLEFNGTQVSASQVHTSFMAALAAPYANVISTEEYINN